MDLMSFQIQVIVQIQVRFNQSFRNIGDSIEQTKQPGFRKLPEFKGWTCDEKLSEFRKVTYKNGEPTMETIPFSSEKGVELLREWQAREAVRGI
jgi:hypothetical protein